MCTNDSLITTSIGIHGKCVCTRSLYLYLTSQEHTYTYIYNIYTTYMTYGTNLTGLYIHVYVVRADLD